MFDNKLTILGAGMAGLIAANMLRRYDPLVLEAKPSLPDNHRALLRFRSDAVARATGIPFKKVMVQKAVFWKGALLSECPLDAANAYAFKVSQSYRTRSVINLAPEPRYIAPGDFIELLGKSVSVQFGSPIEHLTHDAKAPFPVISTIPMPVMAKKILALSKVPEFNHRAIQVVESTIEWPDTDLYQTIYFPGNEVPLYRASIAGNRFIMEMMDEEVKGPGHWIDVVRSMFGLEDAVLNTSQEIKRQPFGKILPTDEAWRRNFIVELTRRQGIYSLGRFATWRQILLDDVVKDVEQIERLIEAGSDYSLQMQNIKR